MFYDVPFIGSDLFWLIVILDFIAVGMLTAFIANSKGHNGSSWFFVGLLFNIVGVIAAAGLHPKTGSNDKECPYCKGLINPTASICKFCRSEFTTFEIVQSIVDNEIILFSQKYRKDNINLIFQLDDTTTGEVITYIFKTYRSYDQREFKNELLKILYSSSLYNKDQIFEEIIHHVVSNEFKKALLQQYPEYRNKES